MRRLLFAVAVAATLVLFTGGSPAMADAPFRLGGQITDRVGALGTNQSQVREALDMLRNDTGTQLYVVYVTSFDGRTGQDWADQTAKLSQLGRRDALLAVAVGDRAYGFSVDQDFPLSTSQLDEITARDVEPRLAAGDWAGAAIKMADGLRTRSAGGASGSGSSAIPIAVGVGGAAVLGGGAYLLVRRARRRREQPGGAPPGAPGAPTAPSPADEFAGVSTSDLEYRASAALIDVDNAVQTSEQELSLAQGEFGDDAVTGFRKALEDSRAELLKAFGVRQQLDDEVPEDEPAKRALLADILRLCRAADARLDEQSAAFDRLRDLEQTAPDYVASLGPRRDAVLARVPEASATSTALRGRYAASALSSIADNVEQAQQRLDAAASEIDHARAELAAGRRGPAVVSGRTAEDAIAQAATLLDGIARLEGELTAAASKIADARSEVDQDLAEARALLASDPPDGLAPLVARAEAALAAAERAVEPADRTLPDPLAALRQLDEAGAALDRGLAAAREEQEQDRRSAGLLDQALLAARSAVSAAGDFISTRRGAVGSEARTRLAEAQRHLDLAVSQSGTDPTTALHEAQQADALAEEALSLAKADVSGWSPPPGLGTGQGGGSGLDLGSLILGGILFGGGRGGWGGGGGGGWGGGGGMSPGSFGGSGTMGRRGGGGRF